MTPALGVFVFLGMLVLVWVVFAPKILPKRRLQSEGAQPSIGEGTGGVMDQLAHVIVLGLGRLTFAALHLFEKLGVDMARVDEALAGWTSYATELKDAKAASDAHAADVQAQLEAALADAQTLRDTDAAEDAAQVEQLQASIADQIAAALETVKNPPVIPDPPADPGTGTTDPGTSGDGEVVTDPGAIPPVDPGPTDPPVPFDPSVPADGGDTPADPAVPADPATDPATPADPPVVVDPETPPVDAGTLPADTPVVEVPADTETPVEVPADAPVVDAGTLPADTSVVEVEPQQ